MPPSTLRWTGQPPAKGNPSAQSTDRARTGSPDRLPLGSGLCPPPLQRASTLGLQRLHPAVLSQSSGTSSWTRQFTHVLF